MSNRSLVLRFAGFLAHLLNEADGAGEVNVQAFAVYKKIMRVLEARELASERGRYDALVGRRLLGPDVAADQAAETYFELVLKRPLCLARDQHVHKGHELFLALCRRGYSSVWQTAQLRRDRDPGLAARGEGLPADVRGVFDRLAQIDNGLSDGNPAKTTRVLHGSLQLHVAGQTAPVAEEMSVWDAICCAPIKLRALSPVADFHTFCSSMIKAVETANAHYGALLSLGLSPIDWRDLSLNTAKKTSAFLARVRERAQSSGRAPQGLEIWREAWVPQPVPGYESADAFWGSELGRALRAPEVPQWVKGPVDELTVPSREEKVLDAVSFERMVTLALETGLVNPCEARVLAELYVGQTTITQIASGPSCRDLLGPSAAPSNRAVADHLRKLIARIRAHAGTQRAKPGSRRHSGSIPNMTRDELPAE